MSKKLFVITGPTAVGKTDEAIRMALKHSCPVLSADSRQIYKELNIGVARPNTEQLASVQHYFIGHVSIHTAYNAGQYANEARCLVNILFGEYDNLVVCGGSGLYIQAFLHGLDPLPARNDILRNELTNMLEKEGIQALQQELKELNINKFNTIDIQNPQRLIRAIEIEKTQFQNEQGLPDFKYPFENVIIKMSCERDILYNRINQRVDHMIEAGLEEEVKGLTSCRELNAVQSVGYKEWWPYFDELITKQEVINNIKQHSRNYAKRQMTWIRHHL